MMRGLLGKELRQHGFALGFLLIFPFGALILIANHSLLRRAGGGGFEAVRLLMYFFLPLACLVLGQLLIASEFRQKTQLFLEGLPLPRWRMLAVKFSLGLAIVLLISTAALAYVAWSARHVEALTPRFAALLLVKSAFWSAFIYALCFAHAFLGRYRLPFGVALIAGLFFCSTLGLSISEFGPFALVDDRFAFERFVWPAHALIVTGGLVLLLTVAGFLLGLVRDATVAALLAEKMSSREKLFLTLLSLVALLVGGEMNERRKNTAPVQMPGAVEARHGIVHVMASAAVDAPSRSETTALQHTATDVANELGTLADYLGCDSYPAVFIVHRRDLAGDDLVDGDLKPDQGVLVRANLTSPNFKMDALYRMLLRATLVAHTHSVAGRERNLWVLDGLDWWWLRSKHGEQTAWDEALHTKRAPGEIAAFTAPQLHAWLTVRKSLGAEKARALAGGGLALLAERHGPASLRHFLSDRYGRAQPADARGWWRDFTRPMGLRLHAATGLTEDAFTAEWRTAMTAPP